MENTHNKGIERAMRAVAVIAGMGICLAAGFIMAGGCQRGRPAMESEARATVIRDTVTDTVTVRMPVPVERTVIRYVTAKLPTAPAAPTGSDLSGKSDKSDPSDSTTVMLPLEGREYADSSFRAWVSGYRVSLDSIRIYPRTVSVTRTHLPRWSLGIQAGLGLSTSSGARLTTYIGLGITYNLLSW